jgi:hypothetical protein
VTDLDVLIAQVEARHASILADNRANKWDYMKTLAQQADAAPLLAAALKEHMDFKRDAVKTARFYADESCYDEEGRVWEMIDGEETLDRGRLARSFLERHQTKETPCPD